MRRQQLIHNFLLSFVFALTFFSAGVHSAYAEYVNLGEEVSIDRIQLVSEQINLLKNRITQARHEVVSLQEDEQISQNALEKASKNLLEKASLDISVAQSNLESINIEVADSEQAVNWLEKNIQEIENQLNVFNVFGLKGSQKNITDISEYQSDLVYQKKLLSLEKNRYKYLHQLQGYAGNILDFKQNKFNRLNALLKSKKMLHIKQQQVKDELAFQEQQNYWLEQMNSLYLKLGKLDPVISHAEYNAVERDIFYANENANFAYIQSLIARYKDQIQQMKLAVYKSNSITILTEISNQVGTLTKQIKKLDAVAQSRLTVLEEHIRYLHGRQKPNDTIVEYLKKLTNLRTQYQHSGTALDALSENLTSFRKTLEIEIQKELSARQGLPTFSSKTMMELGKEILLVPALTFQVIKSLSNHLVQQFQSMTVFSWALLMALEIAFILLFVTSRNLVKRLMDASPQSADRLNLQWLGLATLQRNFLDLFLVINGLGFLYFFSVPTQNLMFGIYLASVWIIFKGILTMSRICLVETTHDTTGHDVRLYKRLRMIILVGGCITGLTVFVHQLPLIYELKSLCDRLFLFLLLIVSILLLRSEEVIANLILTHTDATHPYIQKSIRLIGILIPVLLLANSLIGLLGFVNLILTISWYEGVFIMVLFGYLILRGLLSDGMEHLSRMMIQYVNNGWLLTEAFLKPIDKVLRITLFLCSWALLFLFYGWDKQSPIVARLNGLLHYPLFNFTSTTITPFNILELLVVISILYWTAKWTREFVYRLLLSRTKDLGIRNSIAILSQYSVVILGVFICLRVLNIDLKTLTVVAGAFAFGVGLGLRDLGNNFASGFLLLFERPLRVGDIVNINGLEGDVTHIGSRAVTIRTWDHTELVVPNTEFFTKSFTNWTAFDNIVRTVATIKVHRLANPHEVKVIIQSVINESKDVLKEPVAEVLLKEMNEVSMEFEFRYYVNIRQIKSRISVLSQMYMNIWDAFVKHGVKPPYPHQEILLKNAPSLTFKEQADKKAKETIYSQPLPRNS